MSTFGERLRRWRRHRRYTQMELAAEAEVSTRHLSCLETGKAQPSRSMTLTLAEVLDIPLQETNRLLNAAGFAPAFRARGLDDPDAGPVRDAFRFLLRSFHPFPAIVLDAGWNAHLANEAHFRFTTWLMHGERALADAPRPERLHDCGFGEDGNVLLPFFDRRRFRPMIANFDLFSTQIARHLRRNAHDDPSAAETLEKIEALGVTLSIFPDDPPPGQLPAVVPLEISAHGRTLRLFSTMTMLGTSCDALLSRLRIETFFPADDVSERELRNLAAPTSLSAS
jgi:transcriptional regulator with XRE-family HTH domain